MKLKNKVTIKWDNGTTRELIGETIKVDNFPYMLVVHEATEAWEKDMLKVSEKSTGLGMFTIKNKKIKDVKVEDIVQGVSDFLSKYTLKEIQEKLEMTEKI